MVDADGSPSPAPFAGTMRALPAPAVAVVLAVEVAAVVLVALAAAAGPAPGRRVLALAALLALLGVVHTELATGIERMRRRVSQSSYFDLSSVWTFAAALLLPPALAAAVVVVVYAHLWQRVWRPAEVPPHRHVYTTATVVLAALAAQAAVRAAGGLPDGPDDAAGLVGLGAAVVLYLLVNPVLVACAIALSERRRGRALRGLLGRWDDNALEVATLCLGALAAVALGSTPGLVALVLPPILVLHRAVLVRQLEEVASLDGKTGLLNAAAWQAESVRALRRAQRGGAAAGVLIVDLDHFKAVNDAHGHLAGDEVLAAVAAELRTGVREQDVVGRFGGEEFVVLLPDLHGGRAELHAVAERLRRRVAALHVPVVAGDGPRTVSGLSVSVGGAAVPADGPDLEHVLAAADAGLYAAKRAGRNLVRLAAPACVPAPRAPGAVETARP